MECIIPLPPCSYICVSVYNSLKRIFSRRDKKGAIIIFVFVCAWLLYNSFRQILFNDGLDHLFSCVGFHILLSRISNFKPIIYFQQHKNVSLLMFSFSLSVSRGRHVLNILISTNLSINLKQNQIRMNKNYAAPRQHTSRTNLIRHCKITALYGITKGEILKIYAPNKIQAEFLIEKKRKSLLSFSGKSPRR